MSTSSGFHLPEIAGFAILGATLGAVGCQIAGGIFAAHTMLGMGFGALALIGLAQLPVKRLLPARLLSTVVVRPTNQQTDNRHLAHR